MIEILAYLVLTAQELPPIYTTTIQAQFVGCTDVPERVTLVLNDREGDRIDLIRQPSTLLWVTEQAPVVNARHIHTASARLKNPPRRTDCAKGSRVPHHSDRNQWAVQFRLTCRQEPVSSALAVRSVAPVAISYVRLLPANAQSAVPCAERATMIGAGNIDSVASLSETVYLHFGERIPRSYTNYALLLEPPIERREITLPRKRVRAGFAVRLGRPAVNALSLFDKDVDRRFRQIVLRTIP